MKRKVSMARLFSIFFIIAVLSVFNSCQNEKDKSSADLNPVETFTDEDQPESYTVETLTFDGPWGYNRTTNADRLYPLVVVCYWVEGAGQYTQVERRYPAFVLMYQKNGEGDGEVLSSWIDAAIAAGYRIDANRVYLTGFSMGGSGSYPLAKGMFNKGKYFAAIQRVAGQSQSDLTDAIAKKTAVWYHIGLLDDASRVTVARSALELMRGYACNSNAVETTASDAITGYNRTTVTLTRNNISMFNYSEYEGMGHDPSPTYRDPALFPWIFSQTLADR